MGIFIYNHRTNEQIDIPEGYVPIPNDFPVEEGDLAYVRNPFSKPGIVDVLVPGVWVGRLGANSWISESISIRPISNKQQLPTIFDYSIALIRKEIEEDIQKRKESADKLTYLFNSIRVSPPLPGHDLARRYFRGKISDK